LMARKLSVINQLREKLTDLHTHRSEETFPRHIITQVKDDDRIPKAIKLYRLALLNTAIHSVYHKIQTAIVDTKDILKELIECLADTNKAITIVDPIARSRSAFLKGTFFNITSLYAEFKTMYTEILTKYASKAIADKKVKQAKEQKFLDLKAERAAKGEEQVTVKDLQLEIQKLKKSKNGKPTPKPQSAGVGPKNGKPRQNTADKQKNNNTKSSDKSKGKGKAVRAKNKFNETIILDQAKPYS
jgi:hypothetical protein